MIRFISITFLLSLFISSLVGVEYNLDGYIDTTDSQSVLQIQYLDESKLMSLPKNGKNFGYSKHPHWLRYTIKNSTSEPKFVTIEFMPTIDKIDVYDDAKVYKYGDLQPNTASMHFIYYLHETRIAPNAQKVVWVKVECPNSSIELKTDVHDTISYFEDRQGEFTVIIFYYSAVLILVIFNVILFVALRKLIFLYYILFHSALLIFFLDVNGVGKWVLWNGNLFANTYYLQIATIVGQITIILFMVEFLHIKKSRPFYALAFLWGVLGSYSFFISNISWVLTFFTIVTIVLLLSYLIYHGVFKKSINAQFFIMAWIVFAVGIFLMNFAAMGWIQESIVYKYVRQFGIIFEMLTLTLYMLQIYFKLEKEHYKATQKVEDLYKLSIIDPLTQVLNRRGFFDKVQNPQYQDISTCSVMMIDIDDFKQINDQYGHDTGDKVLKTFAQHTVQILSDYNTIFARYGGEEFIVYVNHSEVEKIANIVLENTLDLKIKIGVKMLGFSVSIGVVECIDSESIEQTITRADNALYGAKRGGKNRVFKV